MCSLFGLFFYFLFLFFFFCTVLKNSLNAFELRPLFPSFKGEEQDKRLWRDSGDFPASLANKPKSQGLCKSLEALFTLRAHGNRPSTPVKAGEQMRLKALKGLPSPRKVSKSPSVAVSPPDMQWRCGWLVGCAVACSVSTCAHLC